MGESVGFIGLGRMGSGMAANLLAAGYALRVYNRSADKAKPLTEKGATAVSSPSQTATTGGVVCTMVADDAALEAVADDAFAAALGHGGMHVSMSTVSPATAEKLSAHHARFGVTYVGTPVFGRPEAAVAKKLWICVSGPAAAKQRVRPLLDAMGQGVFDFGDKPSAANVVKLAGNFMLLAAIEAMAEAGALAEKNGIPRAALLNMLTETLFKCQIYSGYAPRLIAADFDKVGFKALLAFKDVRLALDTATAAAAPMPILSLLRDRYLAAQAKGYGELDASALALGASEDAGLKWFDAPRKPQP